MSSVEPRARRRGERSLTVGVLVALLASLMPLLRVVTPGAWLLGTVVMITALLVAGFAARRLRLPAVAVSLIEALLWVAFMSVVFLRDDSLFGVIPTVDSVQLVPRLLDAAMEDIVEGVAPMQATAALGFLIVGAAGLLTIVVDHVVLTARMPLVAAIALIVVSLIPAIAVPVEPDVSAFVLLAAAILYLVRAETRSREPLAPPRPGRETAGPTGATATALGIGAVAVVVALVVTPALPQPVIKGGAGEYGTGIGLDASLQLGSDLRRPREVEVMLVRSDAPAPPYLRATTLTDFDGDVWLPDRSRTVPLTDPDGFGPLGIDDGIETVEQTTTVEVRNLSSTWLPVSYPATEVTGVQGEWGAVPYNRTLVARTASSQGQQYQIVTQVPRPTLEQIRAREASRPPSATTGEPDSTTRVPSGLPSIIRDLAREVTAEAETDYDRLAALQQWFRGGDFRYSLFAPVEEGFDGSGAEAIARFLEVREGYCIHYASAFALMARTLGMPSRIVVGYLPGAPTTDAVDRQTVHSVSTSRTHAWPEVYFDGVGWVAFEPTNSLGSPTAFSSAPETPGDADGGPEETDGPSASPTASATGAAPGMDPDEGGTATGTQTTGEDGWPPLLVLVVVLIALALPAAVREFRGRGQLSAAREGDVAAAWILVQETAIDVGIPVPAAESPRALGNRLVVDHGVPPDEMQRLVEAIERTSYAPRRSRMWAGEGVPDAASAVRSALLAGADGPRRVLATVAPRSLIIRPGTAYAAARI
jgi:transglutaminase-like putative cysteine protease